MESEEKLPRREREKLVHRRDILEAAKKVFARKGFHDATLDEIAQEAEFAKGTIYIYFESKEDLFFTLLEEGMDTLAEILEKIVKEETSLKTKIESVITRFLSYFQENREFFRILTLEMGRFDMGRELKRRLFETQRRQNELIAGIIRSGITTGQMKELDPLKAAFALIGLIHSFVFYRVLLGEEGSFIEDTKDIVTIFLEGIGKSNCKTQTIK